MDARSSTLTFAQNGMFPMLVISFSPTSVDCLRFPYEADCNASYDSTQVLCRVHATDLGCPRNGAIDNQAPGRTDWQKDK